MLKAEDIRNIEFAKAAMGGYKIDHVHEFLEEVAASVEQMQNEKTELMRRLTDLDSRIAQYQEDESSLKTALLSAQRLADQIMADAKADAEALMTETQRKADSLTRETTKHADYMMNKAEQDVRELARVTDETIARQMADANEKVGVMTAAAESAVREQQDLFDEIKMHVAGFRQALLLDYQNHLDVIEKIPNEIPDNAAVRARLESERVEVASAERPPIEPARVAPEYDPQAPDVEPEVAETPAEVIDPPVAPVEATQAQPAAEPVSEPVKAAAPAKTAKNAKATKAAATEDTSAYDTVAVEHEPKQKAKTGGFKVRVDDDDDDDDDDQFALAGNRRFDEQKAKKSETDRGDEQAGFGFFKKK